MELELQCAACSSGVSSSPAEHKSGPRRGLPSSPPPLSVCVCVRGCLPPPSLAVIAWVPIPALTHPHHPWAASLSAALAPTKAQLPGNGKGWGWARRRGRRPGCPVTLAEPSADLPAPAPNQNFRSNSS